jgi:gas vesicle protein
MNSRFSEEKKQPPYYLITGLLLGLVIGFVVTMLILPVQYTNVPPETLNVTDKDRYRLMIALSYQSNQDIGRATARLGLLRDNDISSELIQQSRRSQTKSDAQVLLNLAQAFQNPNAQPNQNTESSSPTPTTIAIATATEEIPATPSPTSTPTISPTIEITDTPEIQETSQATESESTPVVENTPTTVVNTNSAFQLTENENICNPTYRDALIQIEVFDSEGEPIPNSRITVTWAAGQDTFFTGYFPEISLGYADFAMDPETIYNVKVGNIGELVTDLTAPECNDPSNTTYWGSIYLRFDAP